MNNEKKPSDLSPLFSDEDATPEEIARARRIVATVELRDLVKQRRKIVPDVYKTEWDTKGYDWEEVKQIESKIIQLVLILVREEKS
jgi:hypothetical protein